MFYLAVGGEVKYKFRKPGLNLKEFSKSFIFQLD